jgi:uncharacterized protein (DUF433 family)
VTGGRGGRWRAPILELGIDSHLIECDFQTMFTDLISADPDRLGGTPVFKGTRVMVRTLTEYLQAGETIDAFLDDFPTVTRSQVLAFLDAAQVALTAEPA